MADLSPVPSTTKPPLAEGMRPSYTIALASILLLLVLFWMVLANLFSPPTKTSSETQQAPGIINGRTWDLSNSQSYSLDGTWIFEPNQMLEPADLLNPVLSNDTLSSPFKPGLLTCIIPGTWQDVSVVQKSLGSCTYALRVILPDGCPEILALRLPGFQGASRVYINGRLAAETGTVSLNQANYVPRSNTRTISFPVQGKILDINIQYQNFSTTRGGFTSAPLLGRPEVLQGFQAWIITSKFSITASLLVLGFYLSSFFIFRHKDPSSLFLGLFAIFIGIRTLSMDIEGIFGVNYLLDWETMHRIEYVCFYLSVPFFIHFIHSSFTKESSRAMLIASYGVAIFFVSFVLMSPKKMYEFLLPAYHVFVYVMVFYCLLVISGAIRHKRPGSIVFLISVLVLIGAFSVDIVKTYSPINEPNLSPPILMAFLFVQAFILSWKFNKDYHEVQTLSEELKKNVARKELEQDSLERSIVDKTRDMTKALDMANRANTAKSEFLANISHEIRTPLNGIIGFAELFSDNPTPLQQERYIEIILTEASRLLQLINQLLDISKIEADKLILEEHPFDLHEMFQTIAATMHLQTQPVGLNFYLQLDDRVPRFVQGDALRLRQILDNILSNAVKFTEQGSITLSTHLKVQENKGIVLECSIADTGIGIAYEKQTRIFDSFQQADTSTTRLYGGSGLGTTIAKKLVELMNGKIWFESAPGKGSTFWFNVRLAPVEAGQMPPAHTKDHQTEPHWVNNPVCLLAEDYAVNAEITVRHLTSAGWIVKTCTNGKIAVDLFAKEQYDLVLMDIQMPVMDGYQAARTMRSNSPRKIPIIALSANAFPEDRLKAERAGMNNLIPKPTRRQHLLETIAQYVPPGTYVEAMVGNKVHKTQILEDRPHTKLIQDLEGDLSSWLMIIRGFLEQAQGDMARMTQALDRRDAQTLHRLAHSTKGGAANIGAEDIREKAFLLEKKAKDGDLEACATLLRELVASIKPYLDVWPVGNGS